MLTIRCQCGEIFHAEERHIGRAIRCSRCGHVLSIDATPPTSPKRGSIESWTSTRLPVATRRLFRRWGIAALVLAVVVTTGTALLFTRKQGQQGPITQPPILEPPAEIVDRPASEPLPSMSAARPSDITRPKTGTNLWTPREASGHGVLRINNGTSYDAAVRLRDEDSGIVRRFVYVRTGEVTTLSAIAPCRCRLFFELGTDWRALT